MRFLAAGVFSRSHATLETSALVRTRGGKIFFT
jgi:hypothetical protein